MALLITPATALASGGFQSKRAPINPDFAPDESCRFDAYQVQCVPGKEQDCPEGFGYNEDSTCVPHIPCPEGYHITSGDETGQCYPNSEPCKGSTTINSTRYPYVLYEELGSDICDAPIIND